MIKLNVGLSKKVGTANYGSKGATVNIEAEVDSNLIQDPHRLKEQLRRLFGLARNSLEEELQPHVHIALEVHEITEFLPIDLGKLSGEVLRGTQE